ncbi:MAG: hypothetical protein JNM66_14285 [Bryobacterales bacterium]|nr:hypothetical protein [Bryobacterales bacterium]
MAQRKAVSKKGGRIGSSFDDFLAQQGLLEECEEQAIKQILADQIKAAMENQQLTKAAMAVRRSPAAAPSTAHSTRQTPA